MIISIIIGLCIWFVVPILLEGQIKKKKNKKALSMLCRIIGLVIIAYALIHYLLYSIWKRHCFYISLRWLYHYNHSRPICRRETLLFI